MATRRKKVPDLRPNCHYHKCPRCARVWQHNRTALVRAAVARDDYSLYDRAHTCPNPACREVTGRAYFSKTELQKA